MTRRLSMTFCAVILVAVPAIVFGGETAKSSASPLTFDTPAGVGRSATPGSGGTPSGALSAGPAQGTDFQAAQSNIPKAPAPAGTAVTDRKGGETFHSTLTGIFSALIPSQEDLDKAFHSPLFAPGRAQRPGVRWNNDKK